MLKLRYLLSLVVCLGALSSIASAQGLYTDGHGDIGIEFIETETSPGVFEAELELHWHLDEGAVVDGVAINTGTGDGEEFENDEIIAQTGLSLPRPAGSEYDPIGNAAGEAVFYLPQGSLAGTPFLGFAAEEMVPETGPNPFDQVTWEILNVNGPGEFSIWEEVFGQPPQFNASTAAGIGSWVDTQFTHGHFNIGFTEAGNYDVQIRVSTNHSTYGDLSDTRTFSFSAVPEPSSFALIASLGLVGLVRRRR